MKGSKIIRMQSELKQVESSFCTPRKLRKRVKQVPTFKQEFLQWKADEKRKKAEFKKKIDTRIAKLDELQAKRKAESENIRYSYKELLKQA